MFVQTSLPHTMDTNLSLARHQEVSKGVIKSPLYLMDPSQVSSSFPQVKSPKQSCDIPVLHPSVAADTAPCLHHSSWKVESSAGM